LSPYVFIILKEYTYIYIFNICKYILIYYVLIYIKNSIIGIHYEYNTKGEIVMNWLNNTALGRAVQSYVKVFVTVVLGLFLANGADVFAVDAGDLKTWLAAALASVLPLIITALNPKDSRFGKGTK
jgi:hypothetical protein